jgi:hypothetical protein
MTANVAIFKEVRVKKELLLQFKNKIHSILTSTCFARNKTSACVADTRLELYFSALRWRGTLHKARQQG